ncbi:MAG: zinc ribbon domain-containing protein [Spirochaetes bacterium]|nr:zinc ribbon domain-containing protein [Spirochaetota bacterium]
MPMYDFRCEECGETFSELRRSGDDKDVPCQHCGSTRTKKLISSFATRTAKTGSSCAPAGGG